MNPNRQKLQQKIKVKPSITVSQKCMLNSKKQFKK